MKAKKSNKLTPIQYDEAKKKWASGEYRMIDLAEEYGISVGAFNKRFKKDNIKKGQDKDLHRKVLSETVSAPSDPSSATQAAVIADKQARYLKGMEQIEALSRRAAQKAVTDDLSLASIDDELAALLKLQKISTIAYAEFAKVMRVDESIDKDKLPVLKIEEMTQESIKKIRDQQEQQRIDMLDEVNDVEVLEG